jgi:hypothetical protein
MPMPHHSADIEDPLPYGFIRSFARRVGVSPTTIHNWRKDGNDTASLLAVRMVDEMEANELAAVRARYIQLRTTACLAFAVAYVPEDGARFDLERVATFIKDLVP